MGLHGRVRRGGRLPDRTGAGAVRAVRAGRRGGRTRDGAGGVLPVLLIGLLLAAPGAAQSAGDITTVPIPGTDQSIPLAWIPAGVYRVGSPEAEEGRDADEGPVRQVQLDGFWMAVHEVTVDQFAPYRHRHFDDDEGVAGPGTFDADAVTRPSPPYEDPAHGLGTGDHPAAGMTRYNALHYARWLSLKTGRLFRLPTEAEWEAACRAGGAGGASEDPAGALDDRAWFEANAAGTHHPVGSKSPNALGVYDLQGNVAEWVLDGYDAEAWGSLPDDAPAVAPRFGDPVRGRGVVRGGAFDDPATRLRCAERLPESGAWKERDPQIPKSRWWNTDAPHVGIRLVSPAGETSIDEIEAWFAGVLGG
ncbi:MAG: formylglycine-generating enzyme family protein [Gemmatimonadetes bacterium]|nr:formylglycine-generating enzyme family protein [Gemmatimonadota bacterium]